MDNRNTAPAIESASLPFVGEWNQLVSTTNWEKGRIIHEWRSALIAAGVQQPEYSDDAWAQQVGGVTPQHVGRLRRVYDRFGESRASYASLYWSHFQAALDWDDAEMWLEGALQNQWSVAAMRGKRWETLGAIPDEEPVAALPTDFDEDFNTAPDTERRQPANEELRGSEFEVQDDSGENREDHQSSSEASDDEAPFDANELADTTFRPFESLPTLPADLVGAFESLKLAILRHKLSGWTETSPDDVALSLDALKQLLFTPEN